jgi:hypothetical protein
MYKGQSKNYVRFILTHVFTAKTKFIYDVLTVSTYISIQRLNIDPRLNKCNPETKERERDDGVGWGGVWEKHGGEGVISKRRASLHAKQKEYFTTRGFVFSGAHARYECEDDNLFAKAT